MWPHTVKSDGLRSDDFGVQVTGKWRGATSYFYQRLRLLSSGISSRNSTGTFLQLNYQEEPSIPQSVLDKTSGVDRLAPTPPPSMCNNWGVALTIENKHRGPKSKNDHRHKVYVQRQL